MNERSNRNDKQNFIRLDSYDLVDFHQIFFRMTPPRGKDSMQCFSIADIMVYLMKGSIIVVDKS